MAANTRNISANSQSVTVSLDTINSLRSSMSAGSLVRASDINSLIGLYNTMMGHYHTYTDLYQTGDVDLGGFGNNGDRATYTESKNTGGPSSVSSNMGEVTAGTNIGVAKYNEMAGNSRALASHSHGISDRTNS